MNETYHDRIARIMAELKHERSDFTPPPIDFSDGPRKKLSRQAEPLEYIIRGAVLTTDFIFNIIIAFLYMLIIAFSFWKSAFWFIVAVAAVFAAFAAVMYGVFYLFGARWFGAF
jgi:hypothetical protein